MDQVLTVENIRRRMDGIHKSRARMRRHLDKASDADHEALCELLCAAVKAHGSGCWCAGRCDCQRHRAQGAER